MQNICYTGTYHCCMNLPRMIGNYCGKLNGLHQSIGAKYLNRSTDSTFSATM